MCVEQWREAFVVNAIFFHKEQINESETDFCNEMIKEIVCEYREIFDNDLSKPIQDIEVNIRIKIGYRVKSPKNGTFLEIPNFKADNFFISQYIFTTFVLFTVVNI